jgi:hypothetical protein
LAAIAGNIAAGRLVEELVSADGTRDSNHASALCRAGALTRDLSDAIHAFCALHGASPSIVERATRAPGSESLRDWLEQASAAFDQERRLLAALTAAIGPIPSTPRHAEVEATINGQRHALAILASSDRAGCALGAALALLLDWHAVRDVLAAAAYRSGVVARHSEMPERSSIVASASMIAAQPASGRALAFGAQQLVLQHRGLWRLLSARAEARAAQSSHA